MPEKNQVTGFSDIADVVSVKTDNQLPLVVGGHAVNIWALAYSSRLGLQLQAYAPFTSKDLDLWGPKKMKQRYIVPAASHPTVASRASASRLLRTKPQVYLYVRFLLS